MCGGVVTDIDARTGVAGLLAAGEVACTGVHGANRLASNSLLETVVFAKRVIQRTIDSPDTCAEPSPVVHRLSDPHRTEAPPLTREALRDMMWADVGIVRQGDAIACAAKMLAAWSASPPPPRDRESVELAGMVTCARLIAEAALAREESRGAHYRGDFPEAREEWRRHLVWRG
jgi:L-aspartate oxidase